MTTALVVRDGEPTVALERRGDRALSGMAPMTFEQIVGMGEQLVRTGFLPDHIKNGAQAAAIIMTGQELGMAPMRSIRSLQMVKGKVVESADSQLARFKADGGHAAFRRLDEEAAILFLRHPNGDEHEESFTEADAKAAGLLGKEMYGKFRKAMLRSRVITAGLKSLGWEGGVGNYDPSEAIAFSSPNGNRTAAASSAAAADDDVVDEAMTIGTALAMPLPGGPKAWNGKGGTPLGQLDAKMIPAIRKWIANKIDEAGQKGEDAPGTHYRLLNACDLILEMRQAAVEKDQTKMELGESATPAAGSGENPTTLAPGKIEDALDKPEPKYGDLARDVGQLLKDPKLNKEERAAYKARFDKAENMTLMSELLDDLRTFLKQPF